MTSDVIAVGGLVLRRPAEDDAAAVLALALDPDVIRWNPMRVHDLESAVAWCRSSADWSSGSHASWVVAEATRPVAVATVSVFDIDADHAAAGIGYRVAPGHRSRGIARTTVAAASAWAFEALGLARLQLVHAVDNVASCRVATAAGFALEGTLRSSYLDGWGIRHDEHVHGRLAGDPAPEPPDPRRAQDGRA